MRRWLAVAAAVAGGAGPARANPADAFGFGARAASMAGAHTAAAADGSANHYNPAALAAIPRMHIDLGYLYANPELAINGLDTEVDVVRGLGVGLVIPGRVASVPVAVGVGLMLPDDRITRTRTLSSDQPRFALFDNRPQRLVVSVNAAVSLGARVQLGAGIGYLSGTRGDVLLGGRLGYPDHLDSNLDLAIDVDLKELQYLQLGALVTATDWLQLGAAFRGQAVLDVELAFRLDGDVGPPGVDPIVEDGYFALQSVYQDLFQPAQLVLGAYARPGAGLGVAVDVAYIRWSAFDNPASRIDIDYDLGSFNDLVVIPEEPPLPEPNFDDVIAARVGVEWESPQLGCAQWAVRGGYAFEGSPAPEQSGETNFVDGDKHTFALGGGLSLQRWTSVLAYPVSFDVFSAVTWLPERVHAKLSPSDRIGDYRSGGRIYQLGVTSRWRF